MSAQMKGFSGAQVQEMVTRGATLDGTRRSDLWPWTGGTFGDNYLVATNVPEFGLQAS